MPVSDPQLVQIVAVTAAAIGVLAKTILELVRILRRDQGHDSDGTATRVAAAVATLLETRAQREERLVERLLDLENQETATLGKIEVQMGASADGLRALAERMDRHSEDIRRLTERIGWRLAAVGS